ncbi:MAG TPA: hypothetical protein VH395_09020 [Jatrophihabitantaceae bacterium]|jgi:hypothetical protein
MIDVTRDPDVIAAAAAALERAAVSASAHGYIGLAEGLFDIHGMLFVDVDVDEHDDYRAWQRAAEAPTVYSGPEVDA